MPTWVLWVALLAGFAVFFGTMVYLQLREPRP